MMKVLKARPNNNFNIEFSLPDIELECGSIASFDKESGISYRCNTCFATVGSIGMPRECKELYDMIDVVDKLKGKK